MSVNDARISTSIALYSIKLFDHFNIHIHVVEKIGMEPGNNASTLYIHSIGTCAERDMVPLIWCVCVRVYVCVCMCVCMCVCVCV